MGVVEKIEVAVWDCSWQAERLAYSMNRHQSRYELACVDSTNRLCRAWGQRVSLHLVSDTRALFNVSREAGIHLSIQDSGPISRYLGVTEDDYLAMGVLLGLAQWRVLNVNELIRPEDWLHEPDGSCLYAPRRSVQDYALLLENPYLCSSCRDFYCCLGAETELCLIQELADRFSRTAA